MKIDPSTIDFNKLKIITIKDANGEDMDLVVRKNKHMTLKEFSEWIQNFCNEETENYKVQVGICNKDRYEVYDFLGDFQPNPAQKSIALIGME